jgi:hypothetical protein
MTPTEIEFALPRSVGANAAAGMIASGAVISPCGKYRYQLTRMWDERKRRRAVFIMLNPSTADALQDDPTIRRCIGFARSWGCGSLVVLNLFAIRATNPAVMLADNDPEGPDNFEHFRRFLDDPTDWITHARDIVVCAWGAHGSHRDQDKTVMGWMDRFAAQPQCLGITKSGQPKHPLYIAASTPLQPYRGRDSLAEVPVS